MEESETPRVFLSGKAYPGLAMSRSIGDFDAKDCGVSADPVVTMTDVLACKAKFIVLASDGLWDVMTN
jgi:serine/threonine protein phosphatase PrpC